MLQQSRLVVEAKKLATFRSSGRSYAQLGGATVPGRWPLRAVFSSLKCNAHYSIFTQFFGHRLRSVVYYDENWHHAAAYGTAPRRSPGLHPQLIAGDAGSGYPS